jgi:hypothetical protein
MAKSRNNEQIIIRFSNSSKLQFDKSGRRSINFVCFRLKLSTKQSEAKREEKYGKVFVVMLEKELAGKELWVNHNKEENSKVHEEGSSKVLGSLSKGLTSWKFEFEVFLWSQLVLRRLENRRRFCMIHWVSGSSIYELRGLRDEHESLGNLCTTLTRLRTFPSVSVDFPYPNFLIALPNLQYSFQVLHESTSLTK